MIYWTKSLGGRTTNYKINNKEIIIIIIKQSLDFVAFTNFGKRFFIYIQAVSQCHSLCFPFFFCLVLYNVITDYKCLQIMCHLKSPCWSPSGMTV